MTRKKQDTLIVTAGRDPEANFGIVNPPVYHASTVLYPTLEAVKTRAQPVTYGRRGTPTTFALQDAIAELEGGYKTVLTSSGLSAVTTALLAHLKAGDHLLITDSAYQPSRNFCDTVLSRYGVDVEYYDPRIGAGIEKLIRPGTAVVFTESPGSVTFEVQDLPAISEAAHRAGAVVMVDNTWASPLYFKPFEHGADVSIQAVTKYLCGHSDVMMGAITTTEAAWKETLADHGATVIKVVSQNRPRRELFDAETNHGKSTLTIELETPAGRRRLWDLLATADVIIDGYSQGVLARFGFHRNAVLARLLSPWWERAA